MEETKQTYIVYDTKIETQDVSTVRLVCKNNEMPNFVPGQFITLYFPELGTPQGKAYSISSAPHEHMLSLSVKKIGQFSKHISSRLPGDTVQASFPSGYFYSESFTSPLLLVAGGIGIAPFRSIIIDALNRNPEREISLLYSNKTIADIAFKKELDNLQYSLSHFNVHYFITQELNTSETINAGRINGKRILEKVGCKPETEFLICGSISFTRDIWRDLKSLGIPEDSMYTEAFFSHS